VRASEARYPGTCRTRFASLDEALARAGSQRGVRFCVRPGAVCVRDELHGSIEHDVQAEVGDFLNARRDGAFAYQLAVVVDDARAGVSEVVRGDDLLASTPRQWLVQQALGLPHPTWIHVPLA
jgi:glutamyl/glutaminyl-tRNA synthetase